MENVSDRQRPKIFSILSFRRATFSKHLNYPPRALSLRSAKCLASKYSVWFHLGLARLTRRRPASGVRGKSERKRCQIPSILHIYCGKLQKMTSRFLFPKKKKSGGGSSFPSLPYLHWIPPRRLNALSPSAGMSSEIPQHFQICQIHQNACNEYFSAAASSVFLCAVCVR